MIKRIIFITALLIATFAYAQPIPNSSPYLDVYHLVSAGSTNATVVKASAGTISGWYIYNNTSSLRKLVFHNTASTPTAGASVYFSLPLPPGPTAANVLGASSIKFTSGIGITTVTGITDADNTAVSASDLTINLFYR